MKINIHNLDAAAARQMLTMSELAERAFMPAAQLSHMRKRGTCNHATLGAIAKALDVDPTELMEGTDHG